ncbi:MAG: hypothetical protein IJO11_05640 [Alphaproteobacteria bacterium]|nr:hypothetical protein [Alphaproteobacteria bacterium]MBQ6854905.1 hypothetical protein [Alphaproteobacteria bacterium]MBQ8558169.1 hypothetical protein [Alphaproteobacteria bacterium]
MKKMIYCDLDGVLADFNGTFKRLTGCHPRELERPQLWQIVKGMPLYWGILDMMPDATDLISFLNTHSYQILTGLPVDGYQKAEKEKREWVEKYIHPDLPVICCLSKDKAVYCNKGDILIDDYQPNITRWEKAGGIGILHKDAQTTIARLNELGFK